MTQTREEYLAWCKVRALEYVEIGDCASAVASMLSDLGKWEGGPLYAPATLQALAMQGTLFASQIVADTRRWIKGFH